MKDDAATGETCPTCHTPVITTRDGSLCTHCTGMSRARPAMVARRAAAAVGELRPRGRNGVLAMTKEV